MRGWFGNDSIQGLGGPDKLYGGDGDDSIDGQDSVEGNDFLMGSWGEDYCPADASDEVLECES